MPDSWYFRLGDLFSNVLVGALAGWLCALVVSPGWPMWPAMFLTMAIGMVIGTLLALLVLIRFFGAMEVMLPTMLSGMWAGMVTGMWGAMEPISHTVALVSGAATGLLVILICWWANSALRGVQPSNKSQP